MWIITKSMGFEEKTLTGCPLHSVNSSRPDRCRHESARDPGEKQDLGIVYMGKGAR